MQTYRQTFSAPQTWELNVPGRYYTTLESKNPVNVRFYMGGKMLDLGSINGLSAGLEVSDIDFDRVQIDVTAADTVQVGIGQGNAHYTKQNTSIIVESVVQPATDAFSNSQKTVTNASAVLVPLNLVRQYLLIQNNDPNGFIYVTFGAAATLVNGIKIIPGGSYEMSTTQSKQNIYAIGSIASNASVVVVEG